VRACDSQPRTQRCILGSDPEYAESTAAALARVRVLATQRNLTGLPSQGWVTTARTYTAVWRLPWGARGVTNGVVYDLDALLGPIRPPLSARSDLLPQDGVEVRRSGGAAEEARGQDPSLPSGGVLVPGRALGLELLEAPIHLSPRRVFD